MLHRGSLEWCRDYCKSHLVVDESLNKLFRISILRQISFLAGAHSRFSILGSTTVPLGRTTTNHIARRGPLDLLGETDQPERHRLRPQLLRLQCSDLDAVKRVMNSAAISAAFSLVTVLRTSRSSDSKTYSSVPPSPGDTTVPE